MDGYTLTRQWFDFVFENPAKTKPIHGIIYLWLVELNNRLGWVTEFSSPATQCMAACSIASYNTYKKAFDELIEFGFVEMKRKSINQYTSSVIALSIIDRAKVKALDKAISIIDKAPEIALSKNDEANDEAEICPIKNIESTCNSKCNCPIKNSECTCNINKPLNTNSLKPLNNETFKKEEEGKKMASPSSTLEIDFPVSKNEDEETVSEIDFQVAEEIENKILAEIEAGKNFDPASQTKKIAQGGAATQVLSAEEINDRVTFDINELKAQLKETTEEPEKKKLRQRIVALQGNYIVILPFDSDEFALAWEEWIDFKKKIRNNYQTVRGQQQALNDLAKYSKESEEVAIKIIHRSINNGWKGLFELKDHQNTIVKSNDFNDNLKAGFESSCEMGRESLERMQAVFESLNNE